MSRKEYESKLGMSATNSLKRNYKQGRASKIRRGTISKSGRERQETEPGMNVITLSEICKENIHHLLNITISMMEIKEVLVDMRNTGTYTSF